jgi:hypothetical protein
MGVDDIADVHARLFRRAEIALNVACRIDHRADGLSAAAEQIRNPDPIGMQVLSQDHGTPPL